LAFQKTGKATKDELTRQDMRDLQMAFPFGNSFFDFGGGLSFFGGSYRSGNAGFNRKPIPIVTIEDCPSTGCEEIP